jgi:tripartite-type tricarboxylate transporter receptor subunit TctC
MIRRTLLALAAGLLATAAAAQPFPQRQITVVVPFSAGGTTDVVARIMADDMSRTLGQQIVVENVTGAGGTVGATRVMKAAPDGYTILMGNLGTQAASVGSTRTSPTTRDRFRADHERGLDAQCWSWPRRTFP